MEKEKEQKCTYSYANRMATLYWNSRVELKFKGVRKSLFMTLSSNAFEGSRTTYPPQSPTFISANVAQLVAREAENPKVLGSILDFDRFLGSIPTFDHFLPKKKAEKRCKGTLFWGQTHVPRFLILGWGGHESGFSVTLVKLQTESRLAKLGHYEPNYSKVFRRSTVQISPEARQRLARLSKL